MSAAAPSDGRRVLFDALAARFGGGAYAAVQLARHLTHSPRVSDVAVVTRESSIVHRGLAGDAEVRVIPLPAAGPLELPRRLAWEAARLPRVMRRERADVVMTMAALPLRPRGAGLVCLLGNPVMYEVDSPANRLRRAATRRMLRHASYVAAPSALMAGLVEGAAPVRCAVLPWGVDHEVFSPAAVRGRDVLCVADFYAHKRHDLLLDAWSRLPSPRPRLRFIGDPSVDPPAHARLLGAVAALDAQDSVLLEYRVPFPRLVAAYRGAAVFAIASEHESFCMPLAEALACGVPAVARESASLRATGGSGAVYVDGDDPERWAAAIAEMMGTLGDETRRAALRESERFSWQACADRLAEHV